MAMVLLVIVPFLWLGCSQLSTHKYVHMCLNLNILSVRIYTPHDNEGLTSLVSISCSALTGLYHLCKQDVIYKIVNTLASTYSATRVIEAALLKAPPPYGKNNRTSWDSSCSVSLSHHFVSHDHRSSPRSWFMWRLR